MGFILCIMCFFVQFYLFEQICSILDEKFDLFTKVKNMNFFVRHSFGFFEMFLMNYLGLCFGLLLAHKNLRFNINYFFIPNICLIALYTYLLKFLKKPRSPSLEEKNNAIPEKKTENPEQVEMKKLN